MKFTRQTYCLMLAACSLLLTTGCERFSISSRSIRFISETSAQTKAVYGSDVTDGGKTYQRIPWETGDRIRIASDNAETAGGKNFWDYTVTNVDNERGSSTRKSYGTLSNSASEGKSGSDYDSGLLWGDTQSEKYTFWGMYPAGDSYWTDGSGGTAYNGTVRATIPANTTLQEPADNVYDPVAESYLMVAQAEADFDTDKAASKTKYVTIQFYPAFTAFQVHFSSAVEGVTLTDCWLTATEALTGTFTAAISDVAKDDATPALTLANTGTRAGLAGFSSRSLPTDKQNPLVFSFFCLPKNLSGLTFHCSYTTSDGTQVPDKRLALKDSGNYITFAACKQHRMIIRLTETEDLDIRLMVRSMGQEFKEINVDTELQ